MPPKAAQPVNLASQTPAHRANDKKMESAGETNIFDFLEPRYFDPFFDVDEHEKRSLNKFMTNTTSEDSFQCICGSSANRPCTCSFINGDSTDMSRETTTSPMEKELPFEFVEHASVSQEKKQVS